MKKIVVILGPTATGKTNLALKLCQKFNGEIISVDSRQAYKEMSIGTGKQVADDGQRFSTTILHSIVAKANGIQTHLYDLVLPSERLNAFDYSRLAWEKMEQIWSQNKIPFLVGGTGFYLDVILGRRKLSGVGIDKKLRKKLESLTKEELVAGLRKLDDHKLKFVDVNNKYRLIRAVEIAMLSENKAPQDHALSISRRGLKEMTDDLLLGLTAPNDYLYQRADERVDLMIKSGLVEEVKRLVKKYGWEAPGLNSLGYRELKPYLESLIQLDIAVGKIKFNTHAYIRRQKTYFKKYYADALWFDARQIGFEKEVASKVELFLK